MQLNAYAKFGLGGGTMHIFMYACAVPKVARNVSHKRPHHPVMAVTQISING